MPTERATEEGRPSGGRYYAEYVRGAKRQIRGNVRESPF
jgi:hypothetical protein